ncbi:hypothetical protein ABT288_10660 [Streptomyces sp. NPDC001093]|uniref:hypothetical protein n=1 Tax=Streptomyces sp. NPDC001093 TaxID=3154376 RepID=UPI003321C853
MGTVAGAQAGFWTGRRAGRAALARIGNRRLRAGADRAELLPARYGYARAVVLGRFLWQVIGGLAWPQSLVLGGYWLGDSVRRPDAYLVPAAAAVVVVSLVPVALEVLRGRRAERAGRDTPADVPGGSGP